MIELRIFGHARLKSEILRYRRNHGDSSLPAVVKPIVGTIRGESRIIAPSTLPNPVTEFNNNILDPQSFF